MSSELKDFISNSFGRYFSTKNLKKASTYPFKDHLQFPALVDILGRKNYHHAELIMDFPQTLNDYFFEAFLLHLTHEHIPEKLRDSDLIHLSTDIEIDFNHLLKILNSANKYLIIVCSCCHLNTYKIPENLVALMMHPMCRLLFVGTNHHSNKLSNQIISLKISAPNETDVMLILKQYRDELESFHHVLIPEEILSLAYSLAKRFLKPNHTLTETFLLLDSSAARSSVVERADSSIQFKPFLSLAALTEVLSNWTRIPTHCIPVTKFNFREFFAGMQQKIYGQEAALSVLSHTLQKMQINSHRQGVYYSFLFAGPEHSGKKTTAFALVEQLFGQQQILYFALPFNAEVRAKHSSKQSFTSIIDIKLQRSDNKQQLTLKNVIEQTPYAVILIENIEQAPDAILEDLQEILTTGNLYKENICYQFQQAIFIFSTTIGGNRLQSLTQINSTENEKHMIDLMHLVMNERKPESLFNHHHSPPELIDELKSELAQYVPATFLKKLTIVPFLSLTRSALEKIIHLHLKQLSHTLHVNNGIELGYASEVIRYLCQEAMKKSTDGINHPNPDKALQSLYYIVEQAITSQTENKNRPNQLFLQLNETGQLLRCDWLAMNVVRDHSIT